MVLWCDWKAGVGGSDMYDKERRAVRMSRGFFGEIGEVWINGKVAEMFGLHRRKPLHSRKPFHFQSFCSTVEQNSRMTSRQLSVCHVTGVIWR